MASPPYWLGRALKGLKSFGGDLKFQIPSFKSVLFFLSLFLFNPVKIGASDEMTIYFYNPEVNINNFASLKIEMDTYLGEHGNYRFQPFSDMETFENIVEIKKRGAVLVSSWHYRMLKKKIPLTPILIGVSRGESTYKKILISKKRKGDPFKSPRVVLASAGNEEYTKSTVEEMLGQNYVKLQDALEVLVVPKDIDALMTVGFGMSNVALTSERSLEKLNSINPNLYKSLKTISSSRALLLPVVAIFREGDREEINLISAIEKMSETAVGIRDLKMFGLDSWKRISKKEQEVLLD